MSTNPNNAVGTNAAYGGRTSVNARNDILSAWNGRGIISGWSVAPSSGMSVEAGGVSGVRDVAIVEDASGNKTTVNNISGSPISVTLEAAPTTNSRIDAIVIYVDNPPQGEPMVIDNPQPCGIIAVTGTPDSTPTAPNDSAIRAAITADGAAGVNAYYVVIANITVGSGVTDITGDVISVGNLASINNIVQLRGATGGFTAYNATRVLRLDKVEFATGNKLIADTTNNAVVVGDGVSGVKVSATAYCQRESGNANTLGWIRLLKNNNNVPGAVAVQTLLNQNIGSYGSPAITNFCIPVVKGDKIVTQIVIDNTAGRTMCSESQSWMTVEAIA